MEKTTKKYPINQILFFIALFSWALYLELQTITMFKDHLPNHGFLAIRLLCFSLLGIKGLYELSVYIKQKEYSQFNLKKEGRFFIGVLFMLLSVLIAFVSKNTVIVDTCFLIFSARNQDLRAVVKWFIGLQLVVMGACILGSLTGVLPERVSFRSGNVFRYSLGYSWTSFPAQSFYYISLMIFFVKGMTFRWWDILFVVAGSVFWYQVTDTKNPIALILLFIVLSMIVRKWQPFFTGKLMTILFTIATPAITTLMLVLSIFYNAKVKWFVSLNHLLSNRLALGHKGIDSFGFTAFGQKIEFVDNVNKNLSKNRKLDYNFIDSSFLNILVTKGLLFYVVIVASLTILVYKFMKSSYVIGGLVFLFVVVHSLFDPQLLDLWFSPFPLFIGKLFSRDRVDENTNWWQSTSRSL